MFRNEGLWYVNIDLLIANNISVYTVTQREGDLMLLGPGVVSMRKSNGLSYQTSWNFGSMDITQLTEGFKRCRLDAKCTLTEVIPWHTLVLDAVNNEIESFGTIELELIYKELKTKLVEDDQTLHEFLRLFYIKEKEKPSIEAMRQLFTKEPND
jgi:hypothetical protein